jgi:hypothetical protein
MMIADHVEQHVEHDAMSGARVVVAALQPRQFAAIVEQRFDVEPSHAAVRARHSLVLVVVGG